MEEVAPPAGKATSAPPPPAGPPAVLQDGLSFVPLDSNQDRVVEPFPRSPRLRRRQVQAEPPSQEQLSQRLEELQAERSRTEAHIQSLKKRRADLAKRTEAMKQQVRESFECMHLALNQDQQAVLDSLELDLRNTRAKLDQVLKDWGQHMDKVCQSISSTQRGLRRTQDNTDEEQGSSEDVSAKKADASEEQIGLRRERFEKLLRLLSSVSTGLRAQLKRKTRLLDLSAVVMDRHTCHGQIAVTSEGRGLLFSGSASSDPEHPLQFDKVCCALGTSPIRAGRSYWEVDVRCCAAWAVGVAYGCMARKGRDKGAKLGRNRNSWCVELRSGQLSTWHNDRNVACHGAVSAPGKVGVWVDYDRGQLTFYDADSMSVLQRFSAAVTAVFDRAHHQFTEPLYPAVRFLRPPEDCEWPNHLHLRP